MRIATLAAAIGASLAMAGPALSFAVTNPHTGACREVLLPGPTFPGNWDVVSSNAAQYPGPWNGVFRSSDSAAISGVRCPV